MLSKGLTKKNKDSFKSLVHLSFWTLAATFLLFVIQIFRNAIITRLLGPTNKGLYELAIIIPVILVSFGNMGLGTASLYYVGKRYYSLKKVMGTTLLSTLFLSLILIGIGAKVLLFEGILKDEIRLLQEFTPIILVSIPLLLIWCYGQDFLIALKRIQSFNIFRILDAALPLFFFIIFYFVKRDALQAAIKSWVLAIFIIGLICFLVLKNNQAYPPKLSKNYLKEGLSFGLRGHLANVFHMLLLRIDFFFISSLLGAEALGYYTVSVSMGEVLLFLPESIVIPFIPILFGQKQTDDDEFVPTVIRCVFFIMILVCISLGLSGKFIIYILFGKQFSLSFNPLLCLLPGILALSIFPILKIDFINRNKPGTVSLISGLALFSNLVLNYFLIPKWGISGAAISSSISYGLSTNLLLLVYLSQSGHSLKEIIILKHSDVLSIKHILTEKWTKLTALIYNR